MCLSNAPTLSSSWASALRSSIIAAAKSPYVLHVVPLLIESADYRSRVNRVLVSMSDGFRSE